MLHKYGPIEGRRHDMTVLRWSPIEEKLADALLMYAVQYYLYEDPMYILRPYLQVGFKGAALTEKQVEFYKVIAMVHIAVQWAFKDVKNYFTTMGFSRKLYLKNTPAGMFYLVATILWHFRVCLYKSQSATFFSCEAPTLEEYLNWD